MPAPSSGRGGGLGWRLNQMQSELGLPDRRHPIGRFAFAQGDDVEGDACRQRPAGLRWVQADGTGVVAWPTLVHRML